MTELILRLRFLRPFLEIKKSVGFGFAFFVFQEGTWRLDNKKRRTEKMAHNYWIGITVLSWYLRTGLTIPCIPSNVKALARKAR